MISFKSLPSPDSGRPSAGCAAGQHQAGFLYRQTQLTGSGAAAVGFNCVTADCLTAGLVSKLRRFTRLPLICKPNAGIPVIGDDGLAHYDMPPAEFARIVQDCAHIGAALLGGCCGTTPAHIAALQGIIK